MLKITTPYPYKEFRRKSVNGKRLYENPYGDPVPSVTTILDKTKPKEKREALNRWKKRVGPENAQRIVTEAANVGTIMHNILEHWVKNEEYSGDSILQAKMMADTVKQNIEGVARSSPKCLAVSSSDCAPVMLALEAEFTLLGNEGQRTVKAEEFYQDDGIHYLRKNRMKS